MAGFEDMIGHEQIIEHLQNAIELDKVSHAYIINGEKGTGKMLIADAFAMTLQCEKQQRIPCLKCRSCKQTLSGNQPDIIHVSHEKPNSISVEEIRSQLNNDIEVKPYSSPRKIYIIDEADKLTDTDAALALITGIDSYSPTVTNKASNFIGYSLLLKDGTGLRLYFTEAVTVTIDGIEQVAVEDNNNAGRYHVEIPAVNAAKLDVAHTVVYGDMTITNLSVLSPAAMVATNESKSTNFRNAMIALILYAQSVKAL